MPNGHRSMGMESYRVLGHSNRLPTPPKDPLTSLSRAKKTYEGRNGVLPGSNQSTLYKDVKLNQGLGGTACRDTGSMDLEAALFNMRADSIHFSNPNESGVNPKGYSSTTMHTVHHDIAKKDQPTPRSYHVMPRNIRPCSGSMSTSLVATHPAQYKRQPSQRNPLPTPPPELRHSRTAKPTRPAIKPLAAEPMYDSPGRIYNDPKRLYSAEPGAWDPVVGMHRMDVNPHQPNTVSPVFLIGLPLGSQIEMAHDYPRELAAQSKSTSTSQPRDVPNS